MRMILLALFVLMHGTAAHADTTTGGIQWLDPLGYTKPVFVPITIPTIVTDYWMDMTSGVDSGTCGTSTGNPCKTLRAFVNGGGSSRNLTGLRGNAADGAAAINIKGTGNGDFYVFTNGTDNGLAGSSGKEILIRPWGTAAVTFNRGGENQGLNGNGTSVHHIIIDGGNPSTGEKLFNFVNDDNCDVCYVLAIVGSNVTVARSNFRATGSLRPQLSAVCYTDGVTCDSVSFINNEFYSNNACDTQCTGIYYGACTASGGCAISNAVIKANIVRDMGGECIEINPRVNSTGVEISGNALHNCGKKSCLDTWDCRPAITLAINQSGALNLAVVKNNLIWDTGASCIWENSASTGSNRASILNNSCFDYHQGTASGVCTQGICTNITSVANVKNNIIYAPNGTDPLDGASFVTANNACASGKSCGTSSRVFTP